MSAKEWTACALAALLVSFYPAAASSQSPPYGRIGLYTDESRATNSAFYSGAPTEFAMYIFVMPGAQGANAAEFAVSYPPNVAPAAVTTNPLVSIAFGDLAAGVSLAFHECRTDWVWTHRQQVFLLDAAPGEISIAAHSASGAYQIASCELGNPIEPLVISSRVCLNVGCDPDTARPQLLDVHNPTLRTVRVSFDEAVLRASAEDVQHYELAESGDSAVVLDLGGASLRSGQTAVDLYLVEPLTGGGSYVLRVHDVYDLWGNAIAPGSERAFVAVDREPPKLEYVVPESTSRLTAVFNEAIAAATAENVRNYAIYYLNQLMPLYVPASATLVAPNRVLLLYDSPPLRANQRWTLVVSNVTDLAGNVIAGDSSASFVIADTEPPHLVSADATDATTIEVLFSERVFEPSAETAGNYEIFEAADSLSRVPVAGAELLASGSRVRLTLGTGLVVQLPYVLRVRRIEDVYRNRMPSPETVEFIYGDTDPPVPLSAFVPTRSIIEITFNEPLDEATAETPSHYALGESANPSQTIAVSAATLLEGGTVVRLELASLLRSGVQYKLVVTGVRDLVGNETAGASLNLAFTIDTTRPTLVQAIAPTPWIVYADFSEALDSPSAENAANYMIVVPNCPECGISVAEAALVGDSSIVRLAPADSLRPDRAYVLRVWNVADRYLNQVLPGSTVPILAPDATPPHLEAAYNEFSQYRRIIVVFDEAVDPATAGDPANYLVVPCVPPSDAIVPDAAEPLVDARRVRLTCPVSLSPGGIYAVRASGIRDLGGNVIPDGSEKRFVCSPYQGCGRMGLYSDLERTKNSIPPVPGQWNEFTMYVWCKPGAYGDTEVEFAIRYPPNVVPGQIVTNSEHVAAWTGNPMSGARAVLSHCAADWVWICRQTCYLVNEEHDEIWVASDPTAGTPGFVSCAEGSPRETPEIVSGLCCNCISIATLLAEHSISCADGSIEIRWLLSRTDDGVRFVVRRRTDEAGEYAPIEDAPQASGLSFVYRDDSVEPGRTYRYRIDYVDGAGTHVLFETDPIAAPALPLALHQNWPNPFNPTTTITYSLPRPACVALEIFDIAGRRVASLVNESRTAGRHSAVWNGADEAGRPVAAGIYICRFTAGKQTLSRKMILLR